MVCRKGPGFECRRFKTVLTVTLLSRVGCMCQHALQHAGRLSGCVCMWLWLMGVCWVAVCHRLLHGLYMLCWGMAD